MTQHGADWVSLGAGLVFVVAAVLLLVDRFDPVTQARWAVPLVCLLVAAVLLASVLAPMRRR